MANRVKTSPLVLALDQGTTSSRAMMFDGFGKPVALAQREFSQHFPKPGWVEHDANEIWASQLAVAQEVVAQAGLPAAIGITNQRETTVLWHRKTGEPLAPAIVWQDRRTAKQCEALAAHAPAIQARTGLILDAYFSATKLAWLLDNIAGARAQADAGELAFGTVDSWLIYKLTAGRVHATDVSNAARTLLFNIHRGAWDDELLGLFNIPRSVLPQVLASSGRVGETACEGLPLGIPIAGVAGDQQAALFGQGCVAPGMAKNTYGTGCFMLLNTGAQAASSQHQLLTTLAWQTVDAPRQYALEGSVFVAGAAVQWLRDGLGVIQSASEIEPLAQSVAQTGDVFFVPALTGLGTPYWDSSARGTIVGLTRGTTRAHLARATLEAIAFQSTELIIAMAADAAMPLSQLRVDGGATRNNLLMQMQADFAQIPVTRAKVGETTALGAAFLAGLAVGVWAGLDEIATLWQADRTFTPAISASVARAKLERWQDAVARSRGWAGSHRE